MSRTAELAQLYDCPDLSAVPFLLLRSSERGGLMIYVWWKQT